MNRSRLLALLLVVAAPILLLSGTSHAGTWNNIGIDCVTTGKPFDFHLWGQTVSITRNGQTFRKLAISIRASGRWAALSGITSEMDVDASNNNQIIFYGVDQAKRNLNIKIYSSEDYGTHIFRTELFHNDALAAHITCTVDFR